MEKSKRWLERLITLILASIMALVFFVYVQRVAVFVERESVKQCLSSIRVGIHVSVLTDFAHGRVADMRSYENTNPMRFQKNPPPNYIGEFSAENAAGVAGGQWYYDSSANHLVYRVAHHPLFGHDDRRELRYRLQYSEAKGDLLGLRLAAVEEET